MDQRFQSIPGQSGSEESTAPTHQAIGAESMEPVTLSCFTNSEANALSIKEKGATTTKIECSH